MTTKAKEEPTMEPEDPTDEEGKEQFPTDTAALRDDLKAFGVRASNRVASYLAQGNLEDAFWLDKALSDMNVDVNQKRPFIKYWLKKKGSAIPEELDHKLNPKETRKEAEEADKAEVARSKYSVDEETGAIKVAVTSEKALTWVEAEKLSRAIKKEKAEGQRVRPVSYVFDTTTGQVRMAAEGEKGGTLEQARQLKQMAEESRKEGAESPFSMDKDGNWILNPKATITGLELMAFEGIKSAQSRGESVNPIMQMASAAETMKVYKEAFGGKDRTPEWMSDPVKLIEVVRNLGGGSGDGARATPEWMSDPLKLIQIIKSFSSEGEGGKQPEWMSDPIKLIEVVRSLSADAAGSADAKPDWMSDPIKLIQVMKSLETKDESASVLKDELSGLKQALESMKEDRHREQLALQQDQIRQLSDGLKEMSNKISEVGRNIGSRNEIDIIDGIARDGIGFFKQELPLLRKDVRDAIGSTIMPGPKTVTERVARKEVFRNAIQADKNLEEMGKRLFLGKS